MDEAVVKDFLRELAALTNRYGIAVGGCGCCDSPYLYKPKGYVMRYEVSGLEGNLEAVKE